MIASIRSIATVLLAAVGLFLTGCALVPPESGSTDAGLRDSGVDAGVIEGVPDAGNADGGIDLPPDAGEMDAGVIEPIPDAGDLDAGVIEPIPDAGQMDAGVIEPIPDAGEFDAGVIEVPDAGEPDAGPEDAGAADAGPVVTGLQIAPSRIYLLACTTAALRATATFSDGSTGNVTSAVTWTSADAQIATIDADGLLVGVWGGTTTVAATYGAQTAMATVEVGVLPFGLQIRSSEGTTVPLGERLQLTAVANYSDGSTYDATTQATWTSQSPETATVAYGLVRSVAMGSTRVTASLGCWSNDIAVTVGPPVPVQIQIDPLAEPVPVGQEAQLHATARYSDGTTRDVTSEVTWSTNASTIATVDAMGLLKAHAIGSTTVGALLGDVYGWVPVEVTNPALVSLEIRPTSPTVAAGRSTTLTVFGRYSDESESDVTPLVYWSSADKAIAAVSETGTLTGVSPGETTLLVVLDGVAGGTHVTVTPPVLETITVSPASSTIDVPESAQLTARGAYSDGSRADLSGVVVWSSSDSTVAGVSAQGRVQAISSGSAIITAALEGVSGTSTIEVPAPHVVDLQISQSHVSLWACQTTAVTATATFSDGSTRDVTSGADWSSASTQVAVVSAGIIEGVWGGTTDISAAYGARTATTTVQVLATLNFSVGANESTDVPLGRGLQLFATGTAEDSSTEDLTSEVVWSSRAPGVATVDASGFVRSVATGTTQMTASLGCWSESISVTVVPPVPVQITIEPDSAQLPAGRTQQLHAAALYSDGTTGDVTSEVIWSSADEAIATFDTTGLLQAVRLGTTTVSASLGDAHDEATVEVTAPVPVSVAIDAPNDTVPMGLTLQLAATLKYSDGSTEDVTNGTVWGSLNTAVAVVSVTGGLVSGMAPGTTTITAFYRGFEAALQITIAAPALVSLQLTPVLLTMPVGRSGTFTAKGTFTDGHVADMTDDVAWSSSDAAVATVSDGLVIAISIGTAVITVSSAGISASQPVTISAPALESLSISYPEGSSPFYPGETVQLLVMASYTDGSRFDIASRGACSTSNANVITVAPNGLMTIQGYGSATIRCQVEGSVFEIPIDVSPVVVALTISQSSISLWACQTASVTATATWLGGYVVPVTGSSQWSSSDPSVATVSKGKITAVSAGTTTITAAYQDSYGGSKTATTTVHVSALQGNLYVEPADTTIPVGLHQQLTARGTYPDGAVADLTDQVAWTSSATAVATVSPDGLVSTATEGSTVITAKLGCWSDSVDVTVAPSVLTGLKLTPSNVSIPVGTARQITAVATYSDGKQMDATTLATWSSSDATVAPVNGRGLVSGTGAGNANATITATFEELTATVSVHVLPPALVSISVTSASGTRVSPVGTLQLTATGTWTDGTVADVTSTAAWTSSDATAASVDSGGLVTGVQLGDATIRAAIGAITGSIEIAIDRQRLDLEIICSDGEDPRALPVGAHLQCRLYRLYTNGSAQVVTGATWATADTSIASVDSNGDVVGVGVGATYVSATYLGAPAALDLEVTPAAPRAIVVTPADPTLVVSETLQLTAEEVFSDGTHLDVTSQVTWTADSTVTIDVNGMMTALSEGDAVVSAQLDGLTGGTYVSVAP